MMQSDLDLDDPVTISIPLHPQNNHLQFRPNRWLSNETMILGILIIVVLQWITMIILGIVAFKVLSDNIGPIANGLDNTVSEINNLEKVLKTLTTVVQELVKKIP